MKKGDIQRFLQDFYLPTPNDQWCTAKSYNPSALGLLHSINVSYHDNAVERPFTEGKGGCH